MELDTLLLTSQNVIFKGKAKSIVLPGEAGEFEILPFHKRLLSRLIYGVIHIDEKKFAIKRGIVMVNQNRVVIVVE